MQPQRTQQEIVTSDTGTVWTDLVHRLDTVGSTMEDARRLAPLAHGTVVMAQAQQGGRGRAGRAWVSPPGNLHATVVLHAGADMRQGSQLSFVVANAVAHAVDRLVGPGTALKWPNDVLRGGAKLAGILLERDEGGTLLAGIGMNVAHTPPGMPYTVTSLAALGSDASVDAALDGVMAALRMEWDIWRTAGFAAVLDRWGARGPALGSALVAQLGAERVPGRFAGLRDDGALLLDTPTGRRVVVAGDVEPCLTAAGGG